MKTPKLFSETTSIIITIIGLIILAIGTILFLKGEFYDFSAQLKSDKASQYGDFIGGVAGSLWALAGVILFYIALKEQKRAFENQEKATEASIQAVNAQVESLKLQIQEFELQREELQETRKVLAEQNETFKMQQFENTFFKLLSLYNDIIDSLDLYQAHKENFQKREIFRCIYSKINNNITNKKIEATDIMKIQDEFELIYKTYRNNLNHYFRNIFHIFNFIDKSPIKKRKRYANFARAQFSSYELSILFYYGLLESNKETKKLFEKYEVFKFLENSDLFDSSNKTEYRSSAYGKSN